ncbi:hypothetical protein NEOLEDRAFT_326746 [Neolentinus lepideus HHB14362 ss-1]|uniref:Uncharacterized protein n=1 Tax=Neolentinus lepideus HHB14362 ss-1 TaxID=1314782 RepID=A0A165ST06_9AGAM|nr:hypothetical protein NEOLEDRAFT_326746 [Neolentinus lepideus HHB14362 ss-1]
MNEELFRHQQPNPLPSKTSRNVHEISAAENHRRKTSFPTDTPWPMVTLGGVYPRQYGTGDDLPSVMSIFVAVGSQLLHHSDSSLRVKHSPNLRQLLPLLMLVPPPVSSFVVQARS